GQPPGGAALPPAGSRHPLEPLLGEPGAGGRCAEPAAHPHLPRRHLPDAGRRHRRRPLPGRGRRPRTGARAGGPPMTGPAGGPWVGVGPPGPLRGSPAPSPPGDGNPVHALAPSAPPAGSAALLPTLPPGRVVLLTGPPWRPPRRPWTCLRDSAIL